MHSHYRFSWSKHWFSLNNLQNKIIALCNKIKGVIQAINKLNGYFTKDDEGLLTILANLAGIVLRNSISYDEQLLYHNSLRHILKVMSSAISKIKEH